MLFSLVSTYSHLKSQNYRIQFGKLLMNAVLLSLFLLHENVNNASTKPHPCKKKNPTIWSLLRIQTDNEEVKWKCSS